jgi:putative salt-induced outer membrane protein
LIGVEGDMRRLGRTGGMVLLAAGLASGARAQDTKKPVSFTGDIGFVNTSGNTHLTTLSLGDKLGITTGKLLLTQTFALVYGKSEGKQNANSQLVRARGDYPSGARLSVYGFAGYERNRFAGIDHRIDEGVGLAVAVLRGGVNELDFEAGVGLVQQRLQPDPDLDVTVGDNFVSGRAAARFKHSFNKTTYAQQTLEVLPNLETTSDYRINSETALVAPISRHLGLKAAYLVKYNHAPPSPALARSDRMLTTGVQVNF